MIKFQRDLFLVVLLLHLTENCLARNGPKKSRKQRPPPSRSRSGFSDEDGTCAFYDKDLNYLAVSCSLPTPYCGIDKATGAVQGCVPTSDCPDGGVDDSEIVCQQDKPSCCCKDDEYYYDYDGVRCNDILSSKSDVPWKRACRLPELENLPVCQVNPKSRVWCANQFSDGTYDTWECSHLEFCGIDKIDGRLAACIESQSCPASAKGSEKIVCDPSTSLCCCQTIQVDYEYDGKQPCNDILDWEDTSIWEQACGLPELKPLDVCKVPPTKPTQPPLTIRPPKTDPPSPISMKPGPGGSPDKTKVQLEEPKKKLKAGEIVGIVIGVLILLLIIAAVIWFCWYDKNKGRSTSGANTVPTETTMAVFRMTPAQGQQQLPQPPPNVPQGVQPPMQQGYNYPASQSAQFAPVGQTNQRPNTVSMPNMRY